MANETRRGARAWISHAPEATEHLGEALGRALPEGALVALEGDLGSGKTCFARGIARGLDVVDTLTSPTYALLQSYAGRTELHHLDAWMEGRERAFLLDGGLEWLASSGVTVIEWADRVADVLPEPRIRVAIEHAGAERRRITISIAGEAGDDASLARLIEALDGGAGLEEAPAR